MQKTEPHAFFNFVLIKINFKSGKVNYETTISKLLK